MAKKSTLRELIFSLSGKIAPSFNSAVGQASDQLDKVAAKTKKLSDAAQRRRDAAAMKGLSASYAKTGKAFTSLKSEITGTMFTIGAAATAATAAVYGIAKSSANVADSAAKSAQGLGMSTEAFTELRYAAQMSNLSQQDFSTATVKLGKTVEEALAGNVSAMDALTRAGIQDLRDSHGNIKSTEALYAELADTFASMPDELGKTRLAAALFGDKLGVKMIPMLNAGSRGLDDFREKARKLGVSISETDAKNAEVFNDSISNMGVALQGASLTIGKQLWPVMTGLHDQITDLIAVGGKWVGQELPGWIDELRARWPETKAALLDLWGSAKQYLSKIDAMAQSMGGWIPTIEKLVKAWLAYRAIRIGVALGKSATSVVSLTRQFYRTIPAISRWVGAHKQGVVAVASAFGKAGDGIATVSSSVIASLGKWKGTFGLVMEAVKDYAIMAVGKIKLFALAISKAGIAVAKFGVTLLANPIGLAIAGIVALGAAIYLTVKYWDDIKAAVTSAWATVESVFLAGWNLLPGWIQEPIAAIAGIVGGLGDAILSGLKKDFGRMYAFLQPAFSSIGSMASEAWNVVSAYTAAAWGTIVSNVAGALSTIASFSKLIGGSIFFALKAGFEAAYGFVQSTFASIATMASRTWDVTSAYTASVWSTISGNVASAVSTMETLFASFVGSIQSVLVGIWDKITARLQQKFSAVVEAFRESFFGGLVAVASQFNPVSIMAAVLGGMVDYIVSFDIASAGQVLIARFGEGILSAWAGVKDSIASAVTDWIPGASTLGSAASGVANAAGWVGNKLSAISPFADGGFVSSPQVGLVGEDGPEVIVPLSKPNRARDLMQAAAGIVGMGGQHSGDISFTFAPSIRVDGAGGSSIAEEIDRRLRESEMRMRQIVEDVLNGKARDAARLAYR